MAESRGDNEGLVLNILKEQDAMPLESVVSSLPELSWNQVFTAIDELSRRGEIALRRRGFNYELALC
jgi:hypothetical protein